MNVLRKMLLVTVMTFAPPQPIRVYAVLWILGLFFALQVVCAPASDPRVNRAESHSLLALLLTVNLYLLALPGPAGPTVRTDAGLRVLEGTIFAVQATVLVHFAWLLVQGSRQVVDRLGPLRRLVHRRRVDSIAPDVPEEARGSPPLAVHAMPMGLEAEADLLAMPALAGARRASSPASSATLVTNISDPAEELDSKLLPSPGRMRGRADSPPPQTEPVPSAAPEAGVSSSGLRRLSTAVVRPSDASAAVPQTAGSMPKASARDKRLSSFNLRLGSMAFDADTSITVSPDLLGRQPPGQPSTLIVESPKSDQ